MPPPFYEGGPPANVDAEPRGYPVKTGGSVEGATLAPIID